MKLRCSTWIAQGFLCACGVTWAIACLADPSLPASSPAAQAPPHSLGEAASPTPSPTSTLAPPNADTARPETPPEPPQWGQVTGTIKLLLANGSSAAAGDAVVWMPGVAVRGSAKPSMASQAKRF